MVRTHKKKKEVRIPARGLLDTAFSWSINDVLNPDFYEDQVKKIPDTFPSTSIYMRSFIVPLLEETRADLSSSMTTLSQAPISQILSVRKTKDFQLPRDFFYHLKLKSHGAGAYEPVVGDLIAVTNVRPKCISDLSSPRNPYVIAFIHCGHPITILSSKLITAEGMDKKKKETLFAVYLTNMTTNIRIWRSLNGELEGKNSKIIDKALSTDSSDSETCAGCLGTENCNAVYSEIKAKICTSDLNESQKAAVLSCISTSKCHHLNRVKLIWGPPGTGKTGTIGLMLSLLLKMGCRTLTCAPTNVAVLEVAKRLLKEVKDKESPQYGRYGLGNIVLFGNEERMNINDQNELHDVFLDYRVKTLKKYLREWKHSIGAMISFLEDSEEEYIRYLKNRKIERKEMEDNKEGKNLGEEDINGHNFKDKTRHERGVEENRKGKKQKGKKELSIRKKENVDGLSHNEKNEPEPGKFDEPWTFEEFVNKRFNSINERLTSCILNLCTHLPTSFISFEVVKNMFRAQDLLVSVRTLLNKFIAENAGAGLKQILCDSNDREKRVGSFLKLRQARKDCVHILKLLSQGFAVPHSRESALRNFCLNNARLIFCTVSSSAKLHIKEMLPLEILVIDEAAQLKECESTIPLQLRGLRHTFLIGDERQLPAVVQSKISEKAEFGRSLFERLAVLGHKKHLLNVQHRMHPSISLFPNREFYDNKIMNGQNVKENKHQRNFLPGNMYSCFSFINVAYGKEELDNNHSQRNMVEVSVVSEIVRNLHKEYVRTKKKFRVGVISPYKAQVNAIEDRLQRYTKDSGGGFELNVRSVDGFQGGEKDVIIISTVRCNRHGSIGFLSDTRRMNVALTRARHCLWILGNEATLLNSNSVWKELVIDAKKRGCFYMADEDKSLARALLCSLVQLNEVDTLQKVHPRLFKNAKWKVRFSDKFWYSMGRLGNRETGNQVLSKLEKLSTGWRRNRRKRNMFAHKGASSQLLEQDWVDGSMSLVWTVDLLEEDLHYVQVMMIWDILQKSDISRIAKHLDSLYGTYTTDKLDRCKHKCVEGNLVVPMKWPVDSRRCSEIQPLQLCKPFAAVRIGDVPETRDKNPQVTKLRL